MQLRGRQKVMFYIFAITLLLILFISAYFNSINILTSNLYLLLFLAALYLDRNAVSKMVLVLASAVMIVNVILDVVYNPNILLSTTFLIKAISFVGLYFFAKEFLTGNFKGDNAVNLIILLTLPQFIISTADFVKSFIVMIEGFSLTTLVWLALDFISMILPASVIYYTFARKRNKYLV